MLKIIEFVPSDTRPEFVTFPDCVQRTYSNVVGYILHRGGERLLSSFFRPPRDRGYSVFSIKWTYGFLLSDLMLINLILMIVPNSINIHCTNRIISKIINLLCLKFIKKTNND